MDGWRIYIYIFSSAQVNRTSIFQLPVTVTDFFVSNSCHCASNACFHLNIVRNYIFFVKLFEFAS